MTKEDRLKEWLAAYMPITKAEDRDDLRFVSKRFRDKIVRKKLEGMANKARIRMDWRVVLSKRLNIADGDICKATNTIIEMMEESLENGHTVRLANFGDIALIKAESGSKRVRFNASEQWKRELNPPLYKKELGLKSTLKKKKLIRRRPTMDADVAKQY